MLDRVPLKVLIGFALLATSGMVYSVMDRPALGIVFTLLRALLGSMFLLGVVLLMGIGFIKIFAPKAIAHDKKKLKFFVLATVSMLMPLYCYYGWRWMVYTPRNAGLGLSLFEIPGVWTAIAGWAGLACAFLLLAAALLGAAKKPNQGQNENGDMLQLAYPGNAGHRPLSHSYVACLVISIGGSIYLLPLNFLILVVFNPFGHFLVESIYFAPVIFVLILMFAAISQIPAIHPKHGAR